MVQYIRKKEVLRIFDTVLENLDTVEKDSLIEAEEVYDIITMIKNKIEKM